MSNEIPKSRENTTYEDTMQEVEQALANMDVNADIGDDAFPGVAVYMALGRMQDKIGEGMDHELIKDFLLTMRELTDGYQKAEDKIDFAKKTRQAFENEFNRLKQVHDNPPAVEKSNEWEEI